MLKFLDGLQMQLFLKIAAAAAIDQELIKGWAVWWVLSGYYLVSPVSWMADKPCHAAPCQRGTFYHRTKLRETLLI